MSERRRRRGKGGGGKNRRKGKEFMDAALDAYIRHLALQKWREVTDRQDTLGYNLRIDTLMAKNKKKKKKNKREYEEKRVI